MLGKKKMSDKAITALHDNIEELTTDNARLAEQLNHSRDSARQNLEACKVLAKQVKDAHFVEADLRRSLDVLQRRADEALATASKEIERRRAAEQNAKETIVGAVNTFFAHEAKGLLDKALQPNHDPDYSMKTAKQALNYVQLANRVTSAIGLVRVLPAPELVKQVSGRVMTAAEATGRYGEHGSVLKDVLSDSSAKRGEAGHIPNGGATLKDLRDVADKLSANPMAHRIFVVKDRNGAPSYGPGPIPSEADIADLLLGAIFGGRGGGREAGDALRRS